MSTLCPPESSLKCPYDVEDFHGTSFPGDVKKTVGGVGRNITETVFRLGLNPMFSSVVGSDEFGRWIISQFETMGIDSSNLEVVENQSTAVYSAIHKPDGNLLSAVADMKIFDGMSFDEDKLLKNGIPNLVCFDANIPESYISSILNFCSAKKIPAFFEPTSVPKSGKIFKDKKLFSDLLTTQTLRYISPSRLELESMFNVAKSNGLFDNNDWVDKLIEFNIGSKYRQVFAAATKLLPYIPTIIIKLDKDGALLVQNMEDIDSVLNEGEANSKDHRIEIVVTRKGKGGIR
ncbi:6389_t:CDS:2 [Acaulospora colombiana]|uniref:6389_t:CDS:1 n=1 Tax=Acaulospora colombiana TaxID=27376 RepID=A0ACA9KYZ2_9GLOM|nr:6389_t:CDS:2 [Acaulospora colombiana]